MADAFAFAVSRRRFAGVDDARTPFGALFSALNRLFRDHNPPQNPPPAFQSVPDLKAEISRCARSTQIREALHRDEARKRHLSISSRPSLQLPSESARWPGTSARWLQGRRRLVILRLILNFFLVSGNGQ